MFKKFRPDFMFTKFSEASVDFLKNHGFKGLILDVDNTLEPYENPLPTEAVVDWFSELKEAGISCAIVSNNSSNRIDTFNSSVNVVAYSKASKPFKKNIVKAMEDIGTDSSNTVFMGDQIFTDVWGAHNAGIKAILVPPIKDKRDLFTRFKRLLEKPFIKAYNKAQSNHSEE